MFDFGVSDAYKKLAGDVSDFDDHKYVGAALVLECEGVKDIIAECCQSGNEAVTELLRPHANEYINLLEELSYDISGWRRSLTIPRMLKKGEVTASFAKYRNQLNTMSMTLEKTVKLKTLQLTAGGNDALRVINAKLDALVANQSVWAENMARAVTKEKQEQLDQLSGASDALELVRGESNVPTLLSNFTNAIDKRREIIEDFRFYRTDSEMPDDPDIVKAQDRLIKMLEAIQDDKPLLTIDSSDLTIPRFEVHQGQHATIYKGIRRKQHVAIKKIHVQSNNRAATIHGRIKREIAIWDQLTGHPNIVPYIGCCQPQKAPPFIISVWMKQGDIINYLENKDDRGEKVDCIKLCLDIAEGLAYIHTLPVPIVHGNLKGTNVLVDDNGVARVGDFALASVTSELEQQGGSRLPAISWLAPETLDGQPRTERSDIHSFGCTMMEVFTSENPFPSFERKQAILLSHIREGGKPVFPPQSYRATDRGLTSTRKPIWVLMTKCWAHNPEDRPTATAVRDRIARIWAGDIGDISEEPEIVDEPKQLVILEKAEETNVFAEALGTPSPIGIAPSRMPPQTTVLAIIFFVYLCAMYFVSPGALKD